MKLRFFLTSTLFAATILFTACPPKPPECKDGVFTPECPEPPCSYKNVDGPAADGFLNNFGDGSIETGWSTQTIDGVGFNDYKTD
ncbi:MAG: hypothetical protein LBV46_00335, partial [Bacteroidales bacterium]|nr:hypothetical protein [Bacteroidales bacterium]